jgi:hypothetical protein
VSTAAYAPLDRELVLDRYRPLRPIGRGGSGSVWLARDERSGLEVALKIVPREGKRAARAMREMEAASRLRHERCVRAYGFGGDDGHVYIAYEYVAGSTLRELLRQGRIGDREAVEICAQVLEGLAHAHQRGIVHRDVKPSNVLVEELPAVAVRVLDFGLAQFDDADTLTAVGDVPGTLAYIAPERLRGEDASPSSDVWAVGVMLWEALAGQHPFWGVPLPEVASAIEVGAPSLATQRANLPRALLSAVDGALATDPAKRPSSARLARDLREAYIAPRERRSPSPARTSTTPRRTVVVSTAPPALRAATALLFAGATAFAATLLPFWPPGMVALLALAAGALTLRQPRAALALALFAPVFPLGNVAQGAAVAWSALAVAWLALSWKRPLAGLAVVAGPLLAAFGLIALVPLAVQPVRGTARRALHAAAAVLLAALVAGISGTPLPLTGDDVAPLGIAGAESPVDVLSSVLAVLHANSAITTTALALAITAALLPRARARGLWGLAGLCALQIALVLLWAPSIPWAPIVLGTWALCLLVAARPLLRLAVRGDS